MKYPAPLLSSLPSGVEHFRVLRWWRDEVLATNNTPVTKSLASCGCSFCLCHSPDCRKSLLKGSIWELLCGQIQSSADCLASELHREGITQEGSEGREMTGLWPPWGCDLQSLCAWTSVPVPSWKSAPCASDASADLVVPGRAAIRPFIATPRSEAP